jgi:hypothetical protein
VAGETAYRNNWFRQFLSRAVGNPALTIFSRPAVNFRRLTPAGMRRATPAIPPKMYRHFAVVTVVLTATLAMFADGENGKAAQSLVDPRQAPPAQPPQLVKPSPAAYSTTASEGGGEDFDFGSPMERLLGGDGSGILPGEDLAEEAGFSAEYLASLRPEERAMLLKGLEENGMLSSDVRDSRARALADASSRRSGAPDAED